MFGIQVALQLNPGVLELALTELQILTQRLTARAAVICFGG